MNTGRKLSLGFGALLLILLLTALVVMGRLDRLEQQRDQRAARDATDHSLRVIRNTVFLLLAGGLLVGGATALALGRGIVRAEADLRAERERLRVTLSSIGDGVIVTDAAGRVTFLNPVAQDLTGWSPEASAGRPLREVFSTVDEQTRDPASDPVAEALRGAGSASFAHSALLLSNDGSERPIDDSAAPIRGPDGSVTGAVLVFRDVSQRRRAERDLQQRTRALVEADRRKDEFLAMLGHELRNPLAPVRNCLEILKAPGLDPRVREECREMMERQVRQLTRLTDDLLDMSRISRGRIELRRERLDLRDLVTHGLTGIAPERDSGLHGVSASVCPEPVPVDGDPLRLGQVLANLVNNAMQYRNDPTAAIQVSVAVEQGMGVLRVRDHGIGVAPAMLPRIFEPFVQVDSSLARSRGGLGIGLALVKNLVELHGGTVSAASDGPGRGSEFSARLPLADSPETKAEDPVGEAQGAGLPRRILVVEDNRDSAESLAMLLSRAGHDVRVAHDGASAIAAACSYLPQVILLDIGLPGMDGFEAARRLRGESGLDGTLLVAMTGYGQAQDRQRSKAAGFDRHLTKPVEPEVLYGLLRELDRVRAPLGTD